MATIGTFKKSGNEYTGSITTLSVQAKGVRIVPEETRTNENAPSHRVFAGKVEIGAAWAKRSNEGRDYLGLKLDDPSFTAPLYANLFDDEGTDTYSLIWSRPKQPNGLPGRGVRALAKKSQETAATPHSTPHGEPSSLASGRYRRATRVDRPPVSSSSSTATGRPVSIADQASCSASPRAGVNRAAGAPASDSPYSASISAR